MQNRDLTGELVNLMGDTHAALQELLAPYATSIALGLDPGATYPELAAHLEQCPLCRADLAELTDLTRAAYAGEVLVAQVYPPVNLAFLGRQATTQRSARRPWLIDELGRLVVQFSAELLALLSQPGLAGVTRGQRLYRYVQESGSLQDMSVTIDVFAEDLTRGPGHVRVVVEVFSLSPLDQGGSRVTVRAGGDRWEGETDETGSVDFDPVPLAIIPVMRVEVDPRRV